MDKEFLDQQKRKLEVEKEGVKKELKNLADGGDISRHFRVKYPQLGNSDDENAEEVEEYMENLDLEGHLEDILRNIERALKNIDEGSYGICEKCGKKIDKSRLEAYPEATLCIDDQNRQEKRQLPR